MGLTFRVPERQVDSGYVSTCDRVCYSIRGEANQYGLYAYPAGKPELASRVAPASVGMDVMNRIHDGYWSLKDAMRIFNEPVPAWAEEL